MLHHRLGVPISCVARLVMPACLPRAGHQADGAAGRGQGPEEVLCGLGVSDVCAAHPVIQRCLLMRRRPGWWSCWTRPRSGARARSRSGAGTTSPRRSWRSRPPSWATGPSNTPTSRTTARPTTSALLLSRADAALASLPLWHSCADFSPLERNDRAECEGTFLLQGICKHWC